MRPIYRRNASTQKLIGILDSVLHITHRERELINMEVETGGWVSPEVRSEITSCFKSAACLPLCFALARTTVD